MQIGDSIARTILGIALIPIRALFGSPRRRRHGSVPP